MAKQTALELKFKQYDIARAAAKEAEGNKKELADEIKHELEAKQLDEVDGVEYVCLYKCEKDKETEVFDEQKFEEKDPKKYQQYVELMEEMKAITKKYTKKQVTKGARKLIITRKNEGE